MLNYLSDLTLPNVLSQIHLRDRFPQFKSKENQVRSKGERNRQEQEAQRQVD